MDSNRQSLVDRYRAGDEQAFEELYALVGDRIYRYAATILRRREDAEDVTAQTFAEAYKARHSFRGASSLETWMLRIAANLAHRVLRSRKDHVQLDEGLADADQTGDLHRMELQELVSELPPGLRSAFVLVRMEGFKYREAAEVLGKATGTIQADVHEACKRLRKRVYECQQGPVGCEEKYQYEL